MGRPPLLGHNKYGACHYKDGDGNRATHGSGATFATTGFDTLSTRVAAKIAYE